MASVSISCPNCSRQYKLSDKHIGKRVICVNKSCGKAFVISDSSGIANKKSVDVPTTVESNEITFTGIDEETSPFSAFDPVASESKQTSPPSNAVAVHRKKCRFGILGRMFLLVGLFLSFAGTICPNTVPGERELLSNGRFGRRQYHNLPLAEDKQNAIYFGMVLMISGAILWSVSSEPPTQFDLVIVSVCVSILVLMVMIQIGPAIQRTVFLFNNE